MSKEKKTKAVTFIGKFTETMSLVSYMMLGAVTLLFVPGILALALTLLGFDLDWSTWKTYVGLLLVSLAMLMT